MAEKKAFVLRINPEVLKDLEQWAGDEFRSTNGQIEYLLQQALNARKKKKNQEARGKNQDRE
ncbi:Arc family DNA binding domain-containing protein [Mucilaginibacter sp. HMF5004]|uniref:ribbon-helix-helix domain-containing protein n=1 Tax=Mucilaginibacter rivuli TaxID=2857527 RepID=UPI001C5E4DC3|nr:Arc family DNA binding domain-containing protein [Mucilaginibacter rivuli]MBW4891385.1 Arc family DNA binding domain-containing protein [Mucilaginibacter rivuli]